MKRIKRKKLSFYQLLTVIVILLLAFLYLYKERPNYKIPVLDKIDYLCQFNVKLASNSMEPFLKNGQSYQFNKCFDAAALIPGKIVSYNDNNTTRIGIIRQIFNNGAEDVYVISNERDNKLNNALLLDIYGTNDTDTSATKHILSPNAEEILSTDAIPSHIAKIPKGYGIEISTPQQTTVFNKKTDQFCIITESPEQIYHYRKVIKKINPDKIIKRGEDSVLRQGYNIECSEIDFDIGEYKIIGTKNYQMIFSYNFEIIN